MSKKWEKEELEILIKEYPVKTSEELCVILGRSPKSILHKAMRMGLKKEKSFSKEDDDWIICNFSNCEKEDVGLRFPEKSWNEVLKRAQYLGVNREGVKFGKYSDYEDKIIKEYYGKKKTSEIISEFLPNDTAQRICRRAKQLGLKYYDDWTENDNENLIKLFNDERDRDIQNHFESRGRTYLKNRMIENNLVGGKNRKYTDGEQFFIFDNYKRCSDADMANQLHRTELAVKTFRCRNGLFRDRDCKTNYTNIARFLYVNNEKWRSDSKNYWEQMCPISGSEYCSVHHLFSVSNMIHILFDRMHLEDAFDINSCTKCEKKDIIEEFLKIQSEHPLGICLSEEYHKKFHSIYGYGYNTEEQFYDFLKNTCKDQEAHEIITKIQKSQLL